MMTTRKPNSNAGLLIAMRSETRDAMRIDWDAPIEMDDGLLLRADVFRPVAEGRYPIIITYGPYAKGLSFQEGYPSAWNGMVSEFPEVAANSSNKYQSWEVVDPEKWVRDGYVCVRIDSRGCGRTPGFIDHFSPRETRDFYLAIEWAGVQPWSNGKVGLNGISYYGMNQWQVASLQPPHLAAMCIWEGAADWYRDATHHGGILSTMWANWYDMQVKTVQYGLGERGPKSVVTGDWVCGPETFSDAQLQANRSHFGDDIMEHSLDDAWHKERSAVWDKIEVPFLSAANWGGQGLHTRGNFESIARAASSEKWLEAHGLAHWTHFYTDYGVQLQKQFFDCYLKGEANGWRQRPKVQLQVRHVDKFVERRENEWPLARTNWTRYYLHPSDHSLRTEPPEASAQTSFDALSDGITFMSRPFARDTEITGPLAAHLRVSSSTTDTDVFLVLRVFTADLREITFQGALDPHTPVGQGWLRASHRKLDKQLSRPYRPYHTHDQKQPLTPGTPVDLEIEVLPTSIVVPAGYRVALSVRGKDYEWQAKTGLKLSNLKNELKGCGPFLHNEPRDRTALIYGGRTTIHADPIDAPYILLPVVPAA